MNKLHIERGPWIFSEKTVGNTMTLTHVNVVDNKLTQQTSINLSGMSLGDLFSLEDLTKEAIRFLQEEQVVLVVSKEQPNVTPNSPLQDRIKFMKNWYDKESELLRSILKDLGYATAVSVKPLTGLSAWTLSAARADINKIRKAPEMEEHFAICDDETFEEIS